MASGSPAEFPSVTQVAIERIAAGGDGVGRLPDGMTVFVPRTAPGDVAEIRVTARRSRYARGVVERLSQEGPHRVTPACEHYGVDRCGGCQLQHLSYPEQLAVKRAIVGDALRRIGRRDVADPPVVPSSSEWRYRNRITLAVGGQGTEAPVVGLRRLNEPESVFDLQDCLITSDSLMRLWADVRADAPPVPEGLQSVTLREDSAGGRHLILHGIEDRGSASAFSRLARASNASVWREGVKGRPKLVAGDSSATTPVLSFEQVNWSLGERVRGDAANALGDVAGQLVWDLYSGSGATARLLASRGARVWAVDADRSAVAWARGAEGGEAAAPTIEYLAGRVEQVLDRLPHPDAVVANPPRGGLHSRVSKWLGAWAAAREGRRFCYVSCDPATLARDLARMPELRIAEIAAYDLFPQTAHVETLVVLESG